MGCAERSGSRRCRRCRSKRRVSSIVAVKGPVDGSFLGAESTTSPLFAQRVLASDKWQRFVLLFDDFHQGVLSGTSSAQVLATNAISSFDFIVGLNREPFDLWIDDLALVCRGACPVP